MAFVHLHNHTEFSGLDGASRLESMCARAAELGQTAMAISDHGSLAGTWRFTQAAKAAGIKPVIGIELYMAIGSRFERNSEVVDRNDDTTADADEGRGETKEKRYEHLTVFARNETGWKNLLAIHNKAEFSYWYKARADYELLKEHGEGLMVLTGCLAGPVAGPLSRHAAAEKAGDTEASERFLGEAHRNLDTLIDCVGKENVYLEVMYHGIDAEKSILQPIGKLSREYGIPMVATNDCHYEREEHSDHHAGFLAVGSKKGLDDPTRFKFNGDGYYIKSEQEMLDIFPGSSSWADAVAMTQVIADRCDEQVIPEPHQRLPKFPIPDGFEDSDAYLKSLVRAGAVKRYGPTPGPDVADRLRTELGVISRMGFPDYFLIVWDVINWCRSDLPVEFDNPDAPRKKPILVGPGRGSAAGSCVSYCLEIVGIDPLANNLLFERFLEEGRAGMPDIDVDFEKLRRDEVFAYLAYRWGQANVARIGTFGMALSKAAIKDAARILKPSGTDRASTERAQEIMRLGNKLSDLVPGGAKPYTFAKLEDTKDPAGQAFRDLVEESGQDAQDILKMARFFEGMVKNESIHACGFVVSPEPLDELVPLRLASHSENADPAAPRVICWDGPQVESYGFLKMDVLGLLNLDIISMAFDNIEATTGEHLDMGAIPHPDTKGDPRVEAAYELIGAGRTASVFQMESSGMKKVAQDVVPDCLTDLSAIVALFRPGPLAAKVPDLYAARKNGREPVDYDQYTADPTEQEWIATVLGSTYGLMVFQEDLMRLGTVISGFDAGQRSTLRRAVGKKKKSEMDKVGQMLLDGAEREFHDEDGKLISPVFSQKTASDVYELMKGSAEYLFNASHSAAYAYLAYVTAFLKANWPTEYGAADLAIKTDDEKRLSTLQSLRADGIEVQAPDVNRSLPHTAPLDGAVHIGLSEVKEVGSAGQHIVAEREANGPFTSLHDLLSRVRIPNPGSGSTRLSAGAVQGLIEAGALDSLGSRLGLLMSARAAADADTAPVPAEWSVLEEATRQRQRIGVCLGTHPLTALAEELRDWRVPGQRGERDDRVGQPATPLHRIPDRDRASFVTVGVVAQWSEKGYSGGRRANFTLESSKTTVDGVAWDNTLTSLRRAGIVPKVGDVVAVSGNVRVREVEVGDAEAGTQETVLTKELSATGMWPIRFPDEPVVNSAEVFDFAEAYQRLRALPAPKASRSGSATKPAAKAGTTRAPEEVLWPEDDEAADGIATVTDIAEHRKDRTRTVVLAGSLSGGTNLLVLDGDETLKPRIPVPPAKLRKLGSCLRFAREGEEYIFFIPGALTSAEMYDAAGVVPADSPRWKGYQTSKGFEGWWTLEAAPAPAKAERAA